ncbi:MAG: TatD family hydrolase [Methanotrichaceae archaeon]|nr:TatD family hydrolase [Methanotrichaceae archaeon]
MNELGEGVIDSHCHLDFKHFNKDRNAVIERANDAGIIVMINSGVDFATNLKSLALAHDHDFIHATVGLSPNILEGLSKEDIQTVLEQIKENADQIVGIGEAGLDYYRCRDKASRDRQNQVFQQVIELTRSLDLPLVIHSREAEQQALEIVKDLDRVVFHCYGGSLSTMKEAADRGFYISLATVVCRSPQHQILARNVPLDRLLIETDSPFLSPRGGRNEPSFILDSVKLLARIRNIEPAEVARTTSDNTRRIFGLR